MLNVLFVIYSENSPFDDIRTLCHKGNYFTTKEDRQTHRQTDGQTNAGQSDLYVPLCFAGDTKQTRWECQKEAGREC